MYLHSFSVILILWSCGNGNSELVGPRETGDQWHRIEKREGPVEIQSHRSKHLKVVNANHYSVDIETALPKLKTDWDILLLPEVRLPRERGKGHGQLRNYTYPGNANFWGYYVALNDDVWNVVLFKSKLNLQINTVKLQPLPRAPGDELAQRYGLYIDLNIGKFNLIVISTHLSWGTSGFTAEENINFIAEIAETYKEKNLIFGGAMNTKANAVKDKVRALGYNIFPVDLITVWDQWGWACSDYLISNLGVIDRDIEETFISPHNTVWVLYEIPRVEKYNSNNFANLNTKFKNSLNV